MVTVCEKTNHVLNFYYGVEIATSSTLVIALVCVELNLYVLKTN